MLVFTWFAIKATVLDANFTNPHTEVGGGRNAFESFSVIDLLLLVAALAAIALPLRSASQWQGGLRLPLSATVAILGVVSVVLIVIRIASPPDLVLPGGHVSDPQGAEVVRQIGVWLGLIAAAGVAYGGIAAMRAPDTRGGVRADTASPGGGIRHSTLALREKQQSTTAPAWREPAALDTARAGTHGAGGAAAGDGMCRIPWMRDRTSERDLSAGRSPRAPRRLRGDAASRPWGVRPAA